MARDAAILVVQKERPGDETGDWKQPLRLACHVSLWHMIHFGGHFTLYAQRGQNSQQCTFYGTAFIQDQSRLIQIQYLFNIGLLKRDDETYITLSTEYWNCKVGFWFLKLNAHSIFKNKWPRLSVKSLSWIINFERWNVKLKVECYNLMLAAQVECWGLKLIFGS